METLFDRAQVYVGNVDQNYITVGQLQLELLKMNGCQPASSVLEIGSGCLVAGRPIMQYLMPDRYVGIEPNGWLLEAVKEGLPDTVALIEEKRPLFLDVTDFDASAAGRTFDFVISHSILSHAACWQYPLFLASIKKILAPRVTRNGSTRTFRSSPGRPFGIWRSNTLSCRNGVPIIASCSFKRPLLITMIGCG
jgi:hypothetical protein